MWPIGLCVVALATIFITHWIYKWRNPKCNGVLPPGSMGIPLIGETLELLIPSHSLDLHPFIKKRIQKYGPVFRTNLLGRPVVITADPQLNNYIFQQEGKLVELWYMDSFDKVFGLEGEARPNAVGHIHKYVRGVYLGLFGVESLRTKLLSEIEQTVRTNLHTWSTQGTIDTKKSVASMVAIFAAKCQFGHDFENSADDVTETIYGFVHSLMSFPLNIPGTRFHKCMKDKEKLQEVIRAKLKEKLSNPNPKGGTDFLDHAVKDLNTDFFLTEDFFVYATIGALFATVESISSAITLSFKLFAEHPWVVEDLAAEHEAILKRRENKDSPLTWDEYKSMTATMHVVNEVIRLGNVLPGIFRKALKDIQYNGYTIPAGWAIMAVTQTLQLNPKIFKDPLAFNPRRWKDIDAETASKNFMPFGGGQRQCAGAELAKAFFATFLHVLVTEYRWTKVKGGNVARSPMLRFEEDLIIQVSKKHIEALPKAKCTST